MRYRVTIRPEAEEDLAKIYDIIAYENPAAAMRFVDGIRDLSMSLDHFPRRRKPRDDVAAGVRAQLDELGVEVVDAAGCTIESEDLYSYRREGPVSGRMAGLVKLSAR